MSTTLQRPAILPRAAATPRQRRRIPWPPLIALLMSGGIGAIAALPTAPEPAARLLASRVFRPVAGADGTISLLDVDGGGVAATVPAEGDSFVRGVLSGINYRRRLHGVPQDAPLRLSALDNGRVVLADPGTGTSIDLEAFGPDNLASFARLLSRPEATP